MSRKLENIIVDVIKVEEIELSKGINKKIFDNIYNSFKEKEQEYVYFPSKINDNYVAPDITISEIKVEKGFCKSDNGRHGGWDNPHNPHNNNGDNDEFLTL